MTNNRLKELVDYFGGPTKTAEKLGVKQATASGWKNGLHGMSEVYARKAERITNKKFLAIELNDNLRKEFEELGTTAA